MMSDESMAMSLSRCETVVFSRLSIFTRVKIGPFRIAQAPKSEVQYSVREPPESVAEGDLGHAEPGPSK